MSHAQEVGSGRRFEFGRNWQHFLKVLTETRIVEAENSLRAMLETEGLQSESFLDVGCGSGLFSLAARRLGARVHSFDYDPEAIACAQEIRRRTFPVDRAWNIEIGSILDEAYVKSLGAFGVVYSWGVLHHTGQMWKALEYVRLPVAPGGKLYIAIYNDQSFLSEYWRGVKKVYNHLPRFLRVAYVVLVMAPWEFLAALYNLVTMHPLRYIRSWTHYDQNRGMSRWHDMVDWVGGYPFEVAKPQAIIAFYQARGFRLLRLKSVGWKLGCNEFVFERLR